MRILHIITGLNTGGAEMNLLKLLSSMDRVMFEHEVISLSSGGDLQPRIEALGVRVHTLNLPSAYPHLPGILRLARMIRRTNPDLVQTWLYHADLVGGLAARLAGVRALVWGIRTVDTAGVKQATRWVMRLNALLSHVLPRKILCVAEAARESHARMGYAHSKMLVIPNGFNLERFRPDATQPARLREALGIAGDARLVGLVGRNHPVKDFHTFLLAAGQIRRRDPRAHFVMVGEGVDDGSAELRAWVREAGVEDAVHLLGPRADIPSLLPALDVLVSSSLREGFPQVIGEAMACGVPCAVTDVGDSARIVGNTGRVAPPARPDALAEACLELLALPEAERQALSQAARARVESEYNLSVISERYAQLYRDVAAYGKPNAAIDQPQS